MPCCDDSFTSILINVVNIDLTDFTVKTRTKKSSFFYPYTTLAKFIIKALRSMHRSHWSCTFLLSPSTVPDPLQPEILLCLAKTWPKTTYEPSALLDCRDVRDKSGQGILPLWNEGWRSHLLASCSAWMMHEPSQRGKSTGQICSLHSSQEMTMSHVCTCTHTMLLMPCQIPLATNQL